MRTVRNSRCPVARTISRTLTSTETRYMSLRRPLARTPTNRRNDTRRQHSSDLTLSTRRRLRTKRTYPMRPTTRSTFSISCVSVLLTHALLRRRFSRACGKRKNAVLVRYNSYRICRELTRTAHLWLVFDCKWYIWVRVHVTYLNIWLRSDTHCALKFRIYFECYGNNTLTVLRFFADCHPSPKCQLLNSSNRRVLESFPEKCI